MTGGGEKKFELSEDKYYGLLVKLNSINSPGATFTLKIIHEEKSKEGKSSEIETEELNEEKEKYKIAKKEGLVIALAILLILVYFFLVKKSTIIGRKR